MDLYSPREVKVQGNYAYVEEDDTGPVIIDISNPANPVQKSKYNGGCEHLEVSGQFVYVAQRWDNRLAVVDISNPSNPILADSITTPTSPCGVDVDDNYVYVAAQENFIIYSK